MTLGAEQLQQLYQDVVVDHNRSPRNFRRIDPCDADTGCRTADGDNPLCGDKLHVYVKLDDGRIEDLAFEGSGCAISIASASMMTEALRGGSEAEARELFDTMHELLTGTGGLDDEAVQRLGKLAALKGVSAYPMRVKCATLCWHTLDAALAERRTASTE